MGPKMTADLTLVIQFEEGNGGNGGNDEWRRTVVVDGDDAEDDHDGDQEKVCLFRFCHISLFVCCCVSLFTTEEYCSPLEPR